MAKSMTRGRAAAAVAGGAALLLGTVALPAGAASHDVTYALDAGSISVGPNSYDLPEATGVEGTWDDVTGDFEGTFKSVPVESNTSIDSTIPGASIDLRYEFVATTPVTGNIDPVTGVGSVGTTFDVVILIDYLVTADSTETLLDITCTIADVPVTYDVAGTDVVPESTLFNNLELTANGFAVPAANCVEGPDTPDGVIDLVNGAINDTLGTPTSETSSTINLVLGDIPEPPVTTTRAPVPSTTSTTAAAGTPGAADPARPVAASPRYTG